MCVCAIAQRSAEKTGVRKQKVLKPGDCETSLFYDDTTQSDLIHFRMHEGGSRPSARGA